MIGHELVIPEIDMSIFGKQYDGHTYLPRPPPFVLRQMTFKKSFMNINLSESLVKANVTGESEFILAFVLNF